MSRSASRLGSRLLLQPMLLAGSAARAWTALSGKRGYPQNARRILVAHHLLLGDTLMLSALLAKLRHNHPEAEIVMACPKAILPLFAGRPWGVHAMPYDPRDAASLLALWRGSFARGGFDLALIPGDSRFSWLARGLMSRHTVAQAGDTPDYKNWFVDEQREWPAAPAALPDIFAGLALGEEPPPFSIDQWPLAACAPFERPAAPYAVLHLGASTTLKFWPSERWTTLAESLRARGITPVWSAGRKEMALVAAADPSARFQSYAGRLDLLQLAHLLRSASLLVGPDTGVTHLGRLTATPTITLFGPGSEVLGAHSPFFRNTPAIALSAQIACRNQTVIFRRDIDWVQRCGRGFNAQLGTPSDPRAPQCGKAQCMEALGVDAVLASCDELFNSTIGPKP